MNQLLQSLLNIFTLAAPAVAGANPAVSLGLFALEEAVKQEPAIAQELQALFAAGSVTTDQLAALRAKVSSESYAGFVPASALPPQTTPAAPLAAAVEAPALETETVTDQAKAAVETAAVQTAKPSSPPTLIIDDVVHYLQPDGTYSVTPPAAAAPSA